MNWTLASSSSQNRPKIRVYWVNLNPIRPHSASLQLLCAHLPQNDITPARICFPKETKTTRGCTNPIFISWTGPQKVQAAKTGPKLVSAGSTWNQNDRTRHHCSYCAHTFPKMTLPPHEFPFQKKLKPPRCIHIRIATPPSPSTVSSPHIHNDKYKYDHLHFDQAMST